MESSHIAISKIVTDQIGHMLKDYSGYPITGSYPINFQKLEDIDFGDKSLRGKKIGVLVTPKQLRTFVQSDTKQRYNRVIKVSNIIKFINDKDELGKLTGFNYDYAGVLVGTLKFDYETGEWYVFINQGQHRAAMAYIIGGNNILIPVLLSIPTGKLSEQEEVIIEAKTHYTDAVKRTGQAQPDKLRSAVFCKKQEALELLEFYDSCGVDVGDLLGHEKSCDSWGDIERTIENYGFENAQQALTAIGMFSHEKKINARAVMGLAALGFHFESRIKTFENLNGVEFYKTISKYVFIDRKPKRLSMSDLTKNSGTIKTPYLPMAIWIRYVNEMFQWKDYRKENKAQFWMSRRSPEWQDFLNNGNVEEIFHDIYNQKIEIS
jgi:hypothetical protein